MYLPGLIKPDHLLDDEIGFLFASRFDLDLFEVFFIKSFSLAPYLEKFTAIQ